LPYRISQQNLIVEGRRPLKLQDSVLSFHYYNPLQSQRLIYVVSPYLASRGREKFLRNPRLFLPGGDGFKMIDQPDLLVRHADLRIRREMQLGADWRFLSLPGATQFFPARFADRIHLAQAHMKVMQREAKVDYAIWWGPEDKGLFGGYDFNWLTTFEGADYTRADYLVRRRETETMTATVTGKEFEELYNRWIAKGELITWPQVAKSGIQTESQYRIVIPMDMVPKLGTRRKVLSNVAPGPDVMPNQVVAEIFRNLNGGRDGCR